MRKMNEEAREHDYHMSGYALNSYQPLRNTIDIAGTVKRIVCIALAVGAVALFVGSLIGQFWVASIEHDTFLGFTSDQLWIGAVIGFILSPALIRLAAEDM